MGMIMRRTGSRAKTVVGWRTAPALMILTVLAVASSAGCLGGEAPLSDAGKGQDTTTGGDGTESANTGGTNATGGVGGSDGNVTGEGENTTSDAPTRRGPMQWRLDVRNNAFSNASLTVQRGDGVQWTFRDASVHTVTSDDGGAEFDSGPRSFEGAFNHVFDKVGSYPYHCKIHTSMTAKIVVLETFAGKPASG